MEAEESEGFFYKTLSENNFENQRINIKVSEDDWTIYYYLLHHLVLITADTMTCISCHKNKAPKIL